ncbi:MAG: DUF1328 domain-containing protein [Deltaproteobacteria bacterium]|nr:DUF1328 domain-containing protein [Deltaproteobacteria bacterium]
MFSWGIWALIIAIIAGILGFTGIAGTAAFFAQIVFGIGLVLFIVSLFVGRKVLK